MTDTKSPLLRPGHCYQDLLEVRSTVISYLGSIDKDGISKMKQVNDMEAFLDWQDNRLVWLADDLFTAWIK